MPSPLRSRVFVLPVLLLALCVTGGAWAQTFDKLRYTPTARADLDGDGTPEDIALSQLDDQGRFTLTIGSARLQGQLSDQVQGLAVVDVDRSDRFKEVVVSTPGPSADDHSNFYSYDGARIQEMARDLALFEIQGNGIVRDARWMDFWTAEAKYVLDPSSRTLRYLPQELYYVGQEAKVKAAFPLSISRTDRRTMATPALGSKILVLAFAPPKASAQPHRDDANGWYLIKSATGLMGWASFDTFSPKVDGLHFAD